MMGLMASLAFEPMSGNGKGAACLKQYQNRYLDRIHEHPPGRYFIV
jgi:hypothetical protein